MRPLLLRIPIPGTEWSIPIFGYGFILFITLITSTWFAARTAKRQGGDPNLINDLSLWTFLFGLLGARLFYFIQYRDRFDHWTEFFALWEGGLVVYGAAISGLVTFIVFARLRGVRPLWLLDVLAPSIALGIGIGRLGCLLNGCCYGDYCEDPWAIRFPPASPAIVKLLEHGNQTRLGFVVVPVDERVLAVEPGTPADSAGLRVGDRIVGVNGAPITDRFVLGDALLNLGTAGNPAAAGHFLTFDGDYRLQVERDGQRVDLALRPAPTLPLHPTQLYSSINGFLIFFFLCAYFPHRRFEGELISLFAMLKAVSRFLIEYLRMDETPFSNGLTVSQNGSIVLFVAGLTLWLVLAARSRRHTHEPAAMTPA